MTISKVRIWKDKVWRAEYLLNGKPVEVSYPGEFGPKFLSFVQNGILDFVALFRELQPRTSTPIKDALKEN